MHRSRPEALLTLLVVAVFWVVLFKLGPGAAIGWIFLGIGFTVTWLIARALRRLK